MINLDEDFGDIGTYDLVLLFGILYHLQSPLQTILRLSNAIGRVGIISTRVASGDEMAMYLFHEYEGESHNTARFTAVPTFPAFVTMLKEAGFECIYLPAMQPDHPQWRPDFGNGRRYSFVVSREPMAVANWTSLEARDFLKKWESLDRSYLSK